MSTVVRPCVVRLLVMSAVLILGCLGQAGPAFQIVSLPPTAVSPASWRGARVGLEPRLQSDRFGLIPGLGFLYETFLQPNHHSTGANGEF